MHAVASRRDLGCLPFCVNGVVPDQADGTAGDDVCAECGAATIKIQFDSRATFKFGGFFDVQVATKEPTSLAT